GVVPVIPRAEPRDRVAGAAVDRGRPAVPVLAAVPVGPIGHRGRGAARSGRGPGRADRRLPGTAGPGLATAGRATARRRRGDRGPPVPVRGHPGGGRGDLCGCDAGGAPTAGPTRATGPGPTLGAAD